MAQKKEFKIDLSGLKNITPDNMFSANDESNVSDTAVSASDTSNEHDTSIDTSDTSNESSSTSDESDTSNTASNESNTSDTASESDTAVESVDESNASNESNNTSGTSDASGKPMKASRHRLSLNLDPGHEEYVREAAYQNRMNVTEYINHLIKKDMMQNNKPQISAKDLDTILNVLNMKVVADTSGDESNVSNASSVS